MCFDVNKERRAEGQMGEKSRSVKHGKPQKRVIFGLLSRWPLARRESEREGEKNNSSHPLSYDYLYGLGKQQRQWRRSFVDGVHSLHCSLVEHRRDIHLPSSSSSSSCTLFRTAQLPTAKLRCLEEEKF
ncbi:hypothetical protein T07_1938 [Trichinella nelsoni]|uniref:Uncharacterized protein n=1 Tax=Trichinella nelsoni TaxID=6336 RepID=A0A0V0SKE9_9BILA|nr:hypothetical protein T07_1938 [Trichinella nelsoni]